MRNSLFPIDSMNRVVFLKNIITNKQIKVGDYSYYDDPVDPLGFEKNVLYLFDFIGDNLVIGKFCQIASSVKFIMNGANHVIGLSTYPFNFIGAQIEHPISNKKDTVIGNDVWIGYNATIMPGVKIGDGAIIGTNALVTKDVEPYTIVGGNPAQVIRKRFDDETISKLLDLQWWNWSIEKIRENANVLISGNISNLIE